MFEYLEPDNRGASNLPPSSRSNPQTHPEKVRHLLYGSLAAIDRTIKILHAHGYADPNDWSDPIPVPPGGVVGTASPDMPWMVILTKTLLIEE
ncbi:hypothetical protein [Phormidium tenue]|uniref:hypothetical protein n=1 Tax=Phormidium tenue TaxID=126344 RepID=UPI000937DB8A|nr:hypothetical protein [Phormidium tenue]